MYVCLGLLALSLLYSVPLFANNASASNQSSIVLSLNARPSVLPADGGSYPALVISLKNSSSGMPFIPANNLTIYLSSSTLEVASVPNSIVLNQGASDVTVNVSTTTLAGATTITAVATGYAPSTANIQTSIIGGMPTQLVVYPAPNVILPDQKVNSKVVVQVLDVLGNPVTLGQPLDLTLTSSNSQVGSVPSTLSIPAHADFATTTFNATYVAGTTIITASAGHLLSGSAEVTTEGPVPRRLVVTVAPSIIAANRNEKAIMSIQLQDNSTQTPAIAPSDVSVVVTSNNTKVANITNPIVTIPKGHSYVTTLISSGGSVGRANITASAQGYMKGSTIVLANVTMGEPNQLALSFTPGTLLPDNETYSTAIVAQLQYHNSTNNDTNPSLNLTKPVVVYARSSDNATMQVLSNTSAISVSIPVNYTYAVFEAKTTFLPGTVEVTAQSVGLGSTTLAITSVGSTPNGLRIQLAPGVLPANGFASNSIVISLVNSTNGSPEKAPSNTLVNLAETNPAIGTFQSSVVVQAGKTFAFANFTTTSSPGTTLITASAQNFTSTNTTLTTVSKAATNLALLAAPTSVVANGQQYSMIVELQDPYGNPQKVDATVPVQLSSFNETTGTVPSSVNITAGSTFAVFTLNSTYVPGAINITAFSSGYQSAEGGIKSIVFPTNAHLLSTSSSLYFRKSSNMTLSVLSGKIPVENATVVWSVNSGFLLSETNSTNATGFAKAVFVAPVVPGKVTITVQVFKVGYAQATSNTSIVISAPPPPPTPPQTHTNSGILGITLFSIPVLYIVPALVAAPVVAFMVIRRRNGSVGVDYGEEEL